MTDHLNWVVATALPGFCNGCGDTAAPLYRPWEVFDLNRWYCAECSVAQDESYQPPPYDHPDAR